MYQLDDDEFFIWRQNQERNDKLGEDFPFSNLQTDNLTLCFGLEK